MSCYERHVYFCCNRRDAPEARCANHGSAGLRACARSRITALGSNGKDRIRTNESGCLDRCEEGPVVVYPDAVRCMCAGRSDIDEIIDRRIPGGEIVERLCI